MPSSTSNSDPRFWNTWIRATAILVVLFLAGVELAARFGFAGTSRIEQRVHSQYRASRALGAAGGSGKRTMLLVGNSLLGASVEPEAVENVVENWNIQLFEVENTSYLDWYFGLRRLFAEGSRPDVVAVMLTPTQTVLSSVRGGYFAQYMMDLEDIVDVSQALDLHPTDASAMALSNLSYFYGVRAEIRNVLLGRAMPGFQSVAAMMTQGAAIRSDVRETYLISRTRMQEIEKLVHDNGARLVWILPTLIKSSKGETEFLRAAEEVQIPVLIPIPSGSLPEESFSDGFHLAPAGARQYTAALIPLLQNYLSQPELSQ